MGCEVSIEVGERSILADARLMDTDFHSVSRHRQSRSAKIATAPIVIGANVWVSAGAAVLKGVRIGPDSVIGFGAIVTADVPSGVVAAGNPARILGPIPD
jgi:acetyltransferase-like isoleucine patch superfamily enzyme